MTEAPSSNRAKHDARNWRRRVIKAAIDGKIPLRMFQCEGGKNMSPKELERNIRIGNWLHLQDLKQEAAANYECTRH